MIQWLLDFYIFYFKNSKFNKYELTSQTLKIIVKAQEKLTLVIYEEKTMISNLNFWENIWDLNKYINWACEI